MGEWHKPLDPNHPCTNCDMGACGVSSEMRNGELWIKSDDCHETCQLLRDYRKPVREAYATITNEQRKRMRQVY